MGRGRERYQTQCQKVSLDVCEQNGEPDITRSSKPDVCELVTRSSKPEVERNQETQVRSQRMGIHEASQVPRRRTVKRTWDLHEALFLIAWILFKVQSVQLLSHVWLFETPWIAACLATNSWSLPKLMSIESVMPSSHLILSSPSPPDPSPSQHQSLLQWVNSSHEVAKLLEF